MRSLWWPVEPGRPRVRLCGWCGQDVGTAHLRATTCLDGVQRNLCEYCALDQEAAKTARAAAERQGDVA